MAPSATPDRMSLTTAATREILFDVEGYTTTKLMSDGSGRYFQSDEFTVGGYDWAVRYYPDRVGLYVSVTLVLLSELKNAGQEVGVSFACALRNWLGERWRFRASYVFSRHGQEMGFWRFARHDALEAPGFIVDDCFTLVCAVSVLRKLNKY
ncbi:hypothetical protein HU200_056611 [Digitaria exilis]|uniref:MATH domain-containing protein n=1 Tax=Digitaria exilis TaxID=1010633 RepID=A0A835AIB6_9POAL|nr:hypothetical protein HU200_056611 [Digitaria exilis]